MGELCIASKMVMPSSSNLPHLQPGKSITTNYLTLISMCYKLYLTSSSGSLSNKTSDLYVLHQNLGLSLDHLKKMFSWMLAAATQRKAPGKYLARGFLQSKVKE